MRERRAQVGNARSTQTHTLSPTHTHTHTHSHTFTQIHTHSHTFTQIHTDSRRFTQTHADSRTFRNTFTQSLWLWMKFTPKPPKAPLAAETNASQTRASDRSLREREARGASRWKRWVGPSRTSAPLSSPGAHGAKLPGPGPGPS